MVVWPTDEDPTSRDSSNRPTVLKSKGFGVERHGEKSQKMTQVPVKELNASEPSMRCRKETMIRKLGCPEAAVSISSLADKASRYGAYLEEPCDGRL